MSYVRQSLAQDEEVLMLAKFPWPFHLAAWGALLFLGILVVGVFIWLWMLIHFATTESALTTRRVVYKKGLLRRKTMELGVSTVEQIELKQGLWGRLFGFGTLEISGTGDSHIKTHPMANPVKFRRLLTDARARDRSIVVERNPEKEAA